jgi:diguanylate cyclase (GGDEF)-like protein
LISLKKFLDTKGRTTALDEPELHDLLAATVESYRSALRTMGASALEACSAPGRDLQGDLADLERHIDLDETVDAVKHTQAHVEVALRRWGTATADHLDGKADEVKELLIMLARTAESIGERDQRYVSQFGGLTAELQGIASLDDLTHIRASLAEKAADMKKCVDRMAQDGENSLAQLRSSVSGYRTKIETVEQLASKDALTGLANRRGVEMRMDWNMRMDRTFSVVLIDLNRFKAVNDKHGHGAGDELLKQFSGELLKKVRSDDLVGRWGGDEFMIIVNRDLTAAKAQAERVREWVFGDYTIGTGTADTPLKVYVTASIGVSQWQPDKTAKQLVEEADAAMYEEKNASRP